MKEAYVSFEVAKLLKENGFNIPSDTSYEDYLWQMYDENGKVHWEMHSGDRYFRITQQMACRWLREEHKIHITTEPLEMFKQERIVYEPIIYLLNDFDDFALEYKTVHLKECDTYEEAIEAALEYALKNLI